MFVSRAWTVHGRGQFKHENAAINFETDVFNGPTLKGGMVFGYGRLLAGYHSVYDCGAAKLTKSSVSLGYNLQDVVFNFAV
jgi:hypothetical protein